MENIQVLDRKFTISIKEEEILKQVDRLAKEINHDLAGKNPLFLSVLNGAFMFTSDLMKRITIPCEIQFVKLSSYEGMDTTGKVKKMIGLNSDIKGRTVVTLTGRKILPVVLRSMAMLREVGRTRILTERPPMPITLKERYYGQRHVSLIVGRLCSCTTFLVWYRSFIPTTE